MRRSSSTRDDTSISLPTVHTQCFLHVKGTLSPLATRVYMKDDLKKVKTIVKGHFKQKAKIYKK